MKVSMVSTWRTACGVAEYCERLCNALSKNIELKIISEMTARELPSINPEIEIPYIRCYIRGGAYDGTLKNILEFNPDVVHIQFESSMYQESYNPAGLYMQFLDSLHQHGFKTVMTFHNIIPKPSWLNDEIKQITNWYNSLGSKVICGNEATTNEFLKWAPSSDTSTILLGSTIFDAVPREEAISKLKLDKDNIYIVQPGFYGCYDENTFALTRNGIKSYKELKIGDEVLSLNPETKEVEYTDILDITISDYDGIMYHFKGRSIDLLVTPNHNMMIETPHTKRLYFDTAENFAKKYLCELRFPYSNGWKGKNEKIFAFPFCDCKINTRDFLYLMGIYIGDGHYDKNNNVTYLYIPETDKRRKKIEEVLNRLKIKWHIWNTRKSKDIYFTDNHFVKYFKECGTNAYQKCIPSYLLEYSPELLIYLYDGLIDSDGYYGPQNKEGNYNNKSYYTISPFLVSGLIELFTKLGKHTTIGETDAHEYIICGRKCHIKKSYRLSSSRGPKQLCKISEREIKYVTQKKYTGIVWCVTTKNKNFLVIRNGKVNFCGNSDKGMIQLVKAMPEILKKYPRAKLVFAGGLHPFAPEAWKVHTRDCIKEILKLKLTESIVMLGRFIDETELNLWLGAANIIMLNYHWVSGLYSASASSHRVLCSERPIIMNSEDVRLSEFNDGINCCKTDDSHLVYSILKCLEDDTYSSKISAGALAYAHETTFEKIAEKHLSIYKELLNK